MKRKKTDRKFGDSALGILAFVRGSLAFWHSRSSKRVALCLEGAQPRQKSIPPKNCFRPLGPKKGEERGAPTSTEIDFPQNLFSTLRAEKRGESGGSPPRQKSISPQTFDDPSQRQTCPREMATNNQTNNNQTSI